MKHLLSLLITVAFSIPVFAQKYKVIMNTNQGKVEMSLFDNTPLHRDNFIKLAKKKFYDGLLFHRVIPEFMIQGGDPNSRNAKAGEMLGSGTGGGERVPAEFKYEHIHRRGALAAARDNNPSKASSDCQFYIVVGKQYSAQQIAGLEQQRGKKIADTHKKIYETEGGTPFLDGEYTVFGQVTKGMDVVDKIVKAPRNGADRPNVDQKITSVKVKKKFLGRFW